MKIPKSILRRAVVALREVAQFEAGSSQAPGLITKEQTQEWADAKALAAYLREPDEPEVGVEDEPTKTPVQFTSNQLILLLQIYRGTLDKEFKIGTYLNDLHHLLAHGLIAEVEGGASKALPNHGFSTTVAGHVRVEAVLQ